MNGKILSIKSRRVLPIAFAGLLVAFASGAFAADDSDAPSMKVHFGDLNLSTDAGIQTLYRRIKVAARTVCNESMVSGDGRAASHYWACYDKAVADAVDKVNNTQLTAMYQHATHARVG
jgi:UrcA family protein